MVLGGCDGDFCGRLLAGTEVPAPHACLAGTEVPASHLKRTAGTEVPAPHLAPGLLRRRRGSLSAGGFYSGPGFAGARLGGIPDDDLVGCEETIGEPLMCVRVCARQHTVQG
jgi:hypothetical protein